MLRKVRDKVDPLKINRRLSLICKQLGLRRMHRSMRPKSHQIFKMMTKFKVQRIQRIKIKVKNNKNRWSPKIANGSNRKGINKETYRLEVIPFLRAKRQRQQSRTLHKQALKQQGRLSSPQARVSLLKQLRHHKRELDIDTIYQ